MEKIYLEDINLSKLREFKGSDHKESTLFYNKKTMYKLFNDLYNKKIENKQKKIELLGDGKPLPYAIMPKEEIVFGLLQERFEGYSMDHISKSKTLYQKFIKSQNVDSLFKVLILLSIGLHEIHQDPRNIVISDLHAQNFIIDKDLNPYIVDIDSCKIDGLKNEVISMSLKNYLSNRFLFTGIDGIETTPNTDRLSFIMMALGLIFKKHIDRISIDEFDEKADRIELLNDLKTVVLEIKKSKIIPEVPYLHEMIKDSDLKRIIRK